MNKKGQIAQLGFGIIIAIMLFFVGSIVLNILKPEVTVARLALNCATPAAISDGTKLLCLGIDATIPYYILLFLSAAIGYITSKFLI